MQIDAIWVFMNTCSVPSKTGLLYIMGWVGLWGNFEGYGAWGGRLVFDVGFFYSFVFVHFGICIHICVFGAWAPCFAGYNEMGGARLRCLGEADEAQIGCHLIDVLPLKCLLLTGYRPIDEEYTRNPVTPAKEQRYKIWLIWILNNAPCHDKKRMHSNIWNCNWKSLVRLKLISSH